MRRVLTALVALFALVGAARAEVTEAQPYGFESVQTVQIAAPPAKVWAGLENPGGWWNHSWSGDGKNFTMSLKAGGCWCETLPGGGGVEHLRVIFVDPGKTARFEGSLGPLSMSGLFGHMQWNLTPKDGGTSLTWIYDVAGFVKGGLGQRPAAVDGVLGEQIGRLKKFVETGKPE